MTKPQQTIAVLGGSGFIGRHLVAELVRGGGYEVRLLSRKKADLAQDARVDPAIQVFNGDIRNPESLRGFLAPGCTVINLVYLRERDASGNLDAARNLLAACEEAGVARLIHCSTAMVSGRVSGDVIDETTPCQPVTEYASTKLEVERVILGTARRDFEVVVLRPTAVFGLNGKQLQKLLNDLRRGPRWKNYLKSSVFGTRNVHLVHVETVVAALIFLAQHPANIDGEIFIVSSDEDSRNNFRDVERTMLEAIGQSDYRLPRLPLPSMFLRLMLTLLGRDDVNPRTRFDSGKLQRYGFRSPVSFTDGLRQYASLYHASSASADSTS